MCPFLMPSNKFSHMLNFLETCAPRKKTNMPKKVFLATNISELVYGLIPIKYEDPACLTTAWTIGQTDIKRALLDLGANINLLPILLYQQLGLGELSPTQDAIQLAERSVKIPKGKLQMFLFKLGNSSILLISLSLKPNLCQTLDHRL